MHRKMFATLSIAGLSWIAFFPTVASAQSAIAGLVMDTTGAALPGVTVEAASSALIEKVRTAVTDGQGRYAIVNLRPGAYKVTFTLLGFSTLVREGVELPANFTAAVNVELRVGGLAETLTVSGDAPTVDVQTAARTQVLTRGTLDVLPSSRNMQTIGSIVPGVKLGAPDVGGVQVMNFSFMTVHGTGSGDTTMQVDGMLVNAENGDGIFQAFHNDSIGQEVSFNTSAVPAEVSAGGVRMNIIPKDGGNIFSGTVYIGGSAGAWQSQNITPELRARGLRAPDAIGHIYDVNPSLGGPIARDVLWFFGSIRRTSVDKIVANSFYRDGRPGIVDQRMTNLTLRLTWQASPRNKISAYYDRALKFIGHDFVAGVDPATAAGREDPKNGLYVVGQTKWTSTVSNRLLIEAGYSTTIGRVPRTYQPGVQKPRGSPEWYATASRVDFIRNTTTTARATGESLPRPDRRTVAASLNYVTGSHAFKTGMQWSFGPNGISFNANADLVQRYRDGVPEEVDVFNTPENEMNRVKADVGIYAQDSWTIKRLTANAGVRVEHFNSEISAEDAPAGRFAPARHFDRVPNVPNWNDLAPRLSVVYDLFGNAKTALKASANEYVAQWTGGFARRYNAMFLATDRRDWRDLNGDDVAQDNEIGSSNDRNFGVLPSRHPALGIRRVFNLEYTVGIQHQLARRVSATAAWYRRTFHNLETQDNLLVDVSDYDAFRTPNPLTGEPITIYNLNRAKQGLVDILDTNSKTNGRTYNGFELSSVARLPNGGEAFGGWTAERTVSVTCDTDNSNQFRYCDQSGKLYQELGKVPSIPFRHEFKLAGSYPLPGSLRVSISLLSYAGGPLGVNWSVPASVFPGGRTQAVTVPLIPLGTKFLKRWNQLDLGFRRPFKLGGLEATAQADVFNAFNSSVVLSENQTFGSALGQPTAVLVGRMLRLSGNLKF